ncbi:MAG: YceI family protein [Thermoflexibacter sp.]|nr:YceI family protein [Thermoflexibacter sp.]
MRKLILFFVLFIGSNLVASAQTTNWALDASHSSVQFNVSHLVISEVTGKFGKFEISVQSDKADFTDANISFTAEVNSIDTDNEDRDKHLKSDDFFGAEKFPQIKFVGKSLKKVKGNQYKLTGELTIRDVTKTVILDVIYGGTVIDPWKNTKAGFKIVGKINRKEYGLKWNVLTEAGGAVVGEEVELVVKIELAKK